jgi:chemotaxis signal transduction protein
MGEATAHVVRLGSHYFAMGARMSAGYREYKGEHDSYRNKVLALVFMRLCEAQNEKSNQTLAPLAIRSDHSVEGQTLEIATFRVGNRWFGLRTSQVVEAVEMCDMAAAPGSGKEFVGFMIYNGSPVPVYDINVLSGDEKTQADARQIVVILKKNETDYFGIVVDGLGGIPEINISRLKPIPHVVAGENSLGEALVATESEREDGLLIVLGVDRIAERLADLIAGAKKPS